MEYCVDVKEISYGSVMIEADSKEEAISKAELYYENGTVEFEDADVFYSAYAPGEY